MHLQYPRRLIANLEGDNVLRRAPQASDSLGAGLGEFTGPFTITITSTLSGLATPSAQPAPSVPPIDSRLGIPTVTHIGSSSSPSPTNSPDSSTGSSVPFTSSPITSSPFPTLGLTTVSPSSTTVSSTASPSPSINVESAATVYASRKLSSGAIAAIVFAMVIAAFCALFLIMRRRSRNLRGRQRNTWLQNKANSSVMTTTSPITASSPLMRSGSGYSRMTRSTHTGPLSGAPFVDDPPPVPGPLTVRNGAPTPSISTVASPPTIPIPPTSYNNSNADAITMVSTSSNPTQAAGGSFAAPAPGTGVRTVICTYITTLPDELPIRIGEIIRVVAEYDDGWGLCTNTSGEQGMVPLECLQMGPIQTRPTMSEYDARRSRRASSLMLQ